MNYWMIGKIVGHIMQVEAALMAVSALVALMYGEMDGLAAFLITIGVLLALGTLLGARRVNNKVIYAREGFVIVALSWILLSFFGALPFYISREIPSFIDCFFETVSGFTTTGASILKNVEAMGRGMLFWRSFTHWVGGMGVLVFVLAIVPLAGDRSMHLMRAEVPGPTVGKLVPRIRSTAMILYGIYIVMTVIEFVFLICGGMPVFDSLCTAFGTAGTGGFGIKSASIGYYNSVYIEVVVTVFMILFGINFNLYYFLLIRDFRHALRSEELRTYLGIIAVAILAITVNIAPLYGGLAQGLRYASFQVGSIITTTGFATTDFDMWPEFSRIILLLLMMMGACAGSTAGGLKTSRIIIMFKAVRREVRSLLHPRSVSVVKLEGKPLDATVVRGASVFLMVYIMIFGLSTLLVALDNFDFTTTFSAVCTCLNNVGPGLSIVGPAGNFAGFTVGSKLVLSANMLFGRLEIFPMLLLFAPSLWRKK